MNVKLRSACRRCAGLPDRASERVARCRNVGAAHESLADQGVRRCVRRISTSLPTKSVGKWGDERVACRTRMVRTSAWHRDATCGELARVLARRTPRLHHACQSPLDQGLSVAVRRISTSLPTFSVEKSAWRSRGAAPRASRAPCRRASADVGQADGVATNSGCVKGRAKRVGRFQNRVAACAADVVDGTRIAASRSAEPGIALVRPGLAHSLRTPAKSFRINRLPSLAAGCPQACQHNLWKRRRSRVYQAGTGKRTVTVNPRPPCVVASATVARCCSAILLTIDRPSPLPDDVAACAPSPR